MLNMESAYTNSFPKKTRSGLWLLPIDPPSSVKDDSTDIDPPNSTGVTAQTTNVFEHITHVLGLQEEEYEEV